MDLSKEKRQEADRMMRLVKGRSIPEEWNDTDIEAMYDEYFKRLWYNQERAYVDM